MEFRHVKVGQLFEFVKEGNPVQVLETGVHHDRVNKKTGENCYVTSFGTTQRIVFPNSQVLPVYTYVLRKQTFEQAMDEVPLLDLPIVFEGTMHECHVYALNEGYDWRQSRRMLSGGYYGREDDTCLYLDIQI